MLGRVRAVLCGWSDPATSRGMIGREATGLLLACGSLLSEEFLQQSPAFRLQDAAKHRGPMVQPRVVGDLEQ
jgi:hypothetical protein